MRKISSVLITAAVISALSAGMTANAATVDEIAAAARAKGYTEDQIQQGYNAYYADPSAYTPEQLDEVLNMVENSGDVIINTVPYNPEAAPVITTTTASETPEISGITLTAPDGSEFTRISEDEFINLSYDEKMAYLSGFPQDKQKVIIDSLSPLEYRSLIKQAPTEKKLEIVDSISDVAEGMGLTVTVDEVDDDNLTLSARNNEGTLVSVSNAKVAVEDTGFDRRWLVSAIAASLSAAIVGIALVITKCFGKGESESINGK